jgi:hypothetical protein
MWSSISYKNISKSTKENLGPGVKHRVGWVTGVRNTAFCLGLKHEKREEI